jgi:SAM-dependent methyltransferase
VSDYVKDYFDRRAEAWVEQAYVEGPVPSKFPIGPERVRLALEAVAPAVGAEGAFVDLGCGGGQLCLGAAQLGWRVTGVDVAAGMIEESRRLCEGLPVELLLAPYEENNLPDGAFDAVTAIGLIEYLPDDDGLFAEASRLLRPGGRFAVSCRNRLYNLHSANEYTARELDAGAAALLAELRDELVRTTRDELIALADSVAAAADELRLAAELDAAEPAPDLLDHPTAFTGERRQHVPSELEAAAARAGLTRVEILAVHPHPLPAGVEPLSPRVYNRLAKAWQRPLERSPLGLAFSTAFLAVFQKEQ